MLYLKRKILIFMNLYLIIKTDSLKTHWTVKNLLGETEIHRKVILFSWITNSFRSWGSGGYETGAGWYLRSCKILFPSLSCSLCSGLWIYKLAKLVYWNVDITNSNSYCLSITYSVPDYLSANTYFSPLIKPQKKY